MEALTKQLLNSLKCPICRGQIDVLNWAIQKKYEFGCVYDLDHYRIKLNDGYICREAVSFYDKKHKYLVEKEYKDLQLITTVRIFDTDPEMRVNFSFKENKIVTDLNLFDFQKQDFDKEKALSRLKTYLVFQ